MSISIEMVMMNSGFLTFLGGIIAGKLVMGIIRLLYIFAIIKTTSNITMGDSINPINIIKTSFSKIWHVFFQIIICSGVLVPSALIVLVLLTAFLVPNWISTLIVYTILGLLCIKIIFSIHGVLISNLDALEAIYESLSITKGNYIRLILTVLVLWSINFVTKSGVGLLVNGSFIAYILEFVIVAFMTIIQMTLLTSMYHQIVPLEATNQTELKEMN